MDFFAWWRERLARNLVLALFVAVLVLLSILGGAWAFIKETAPLVPAAVEMFTLTEWTAIAVMVVGLVLLGLLVGVVLRTTRGPIIVGSARARRSRSERDLAEQVEHYRELYEEAEDKWWTEDEKLKVTQRDIQQNKMGEPLGVEVTVMSEEPIYPICLRFWFSDKVQDDPVFWFTPDPSREFGPSDLDGSFGDRRKVSVRDDGMVEVFFSGHTLYTPGNKREPQDVLFGEAQAKLRVYAASEDVTSFRLLRVQRRYRVS